MAKAVLRPQSSSPFIRGSLQPGVFQLRLLQNRDVGIRFFPEGEEIFVGSFCFGLISRQGERSAQLQVRQRSYGIADNDPAVIENFLEFGGGFGALVRGQISLATHVGRIKTSEEGEKADAWYRQLVRSGDL